jgi:group I intron endonuclease
MKSGIYKITHVVSGRVYVGSARDLIDRWRRHRSLLRRGVHHSIRLQRAWIKLGPEAFSFTILERILPDALVEREQFWIDSLDAFGVNGYNMTPKAGSSSGRKLSAETKIKISKGRRANPGPGPGDAAVQKMLECRSGYRLSERSPDLVKAHVEKRLRTIAFRRAEGFPKSAKMIASVELRRATWKPSAIMIEAARSVSIGRKNSERCLLPFTVNRDG